MVPTTVRRCFDDDAVSFRALFYLENTLKNLKQENGIEFAASRGGDSGELFTQKLSEILNLKQVIYMLFVMIITRLQIL